MYRFITVCVAISDESLIYPYGIISLANKRSSLPVGTAVEFQVAKVNGSRERAVNVLNVKEVVTGFVDSLKGSFGFISIEDREKNVYFK